MVSSSAEGFGQNSFAGKELDGPAGKKTPAQARQPGISRDGNNWQFAGNLVHWSRNFTGF
jgi:hypothetical protein